MTIDDRLLELGIELPAPAQPAFNYVPFMIWNDVLYLAGQVPKEGDDVRIVGHVNSDVSLADAQQAARICTLQGLAWAREALGGLDRVDRVLKVTGFVNSSPDFVEQPTVLEAASELLVEIFGERGRHTRSAVGVTSLPRGSAVEIELTFGIR